MNVASSAPAETVGSPSAPGRLRRTRWWKVALTALAVVLVAEAVARLLAPTMKPVYRWPDSSYATHDEQLAALGDDVDLLVVGSSSAGIAVRPDNLSSDGAAGSGYNFWLAGPGMRSIELLTADVLLDRTTPSTVLIGVTMREFNENEALDEHVAALEQSPAFLEATGRAGLLDIADDGLQRFSALARLRGTLRDPIRAAREVDAPPFQPDPLEHDGYLDGRGDHQVANEPATHIEQERRAMADYTVSPLEVEALAGLLDELDRRGIRAVVVNLPVTDRFVQMADDGRLDYERFASTVESTTIGHHGEWLDAMAWRPWPDRYFGDSNHLNERGTQRLRPLVTSTLQRR